MTTNRSIEVCYDVASAAHASMQTGGVTGVPRVVENVLRELVRSSECQVRFCTSASAVEARLYIENKFGANGRDLIHPAAHRALGRMLTSFAARLSARKDARGLFDRIARRLYFSRVIPKWDNMDDDALASADIYHSPHGSIPSQVRVHANLKVFLTVYDLIPYRRPEFFPEGVLDAQRKIFETARLGEDRFLCISEFTKQDLCEIYRIDPQRVFVTPLAAAEDTFHPCSDSEARAATLRSLEVPQAPYILSVCTLEPRKNLKCILRAFRSVVNSARTKDLHLLLVGGKGWFEGPLLEELEALGALRERVHLLGYVPDEDLAALYSGALCFVYMSYYEGFGLPPLEAMQCGVPVITSNTSSLPEVVGDAGICLAPEDEAGVADAIAMLHSNSFRCEEMGAKSLARAHHFSWARCAEQTIAAYRTAL